MIVTFSFRTERAYVLLAFIVLMAMGLGLTLPLEHAGRAWVGGLLCGLSLVCWGWFLSMGGAKKL